MARRLLNLRGAPAAALAALILLPSLAYPLGRDHGIFGYVGQGLLHGELPYRDVWDLKPPGIYWLFALLVAPFGMAAPWLRGVDLAVACLTAILLFHLGLRWHSRTAGLLAAGWFAALYLRSGFWSLIQAESFANPLLVGSVLLADRARTGTETDRQRALLAAGLLAGATATLKYTLPLAVLPLIAAAAWSTRPGKPGRRLRASGAALVGLAVGPLVMVVWLLASGCWPAFIEVHRDYLPGYAALSRGHLWSRALGYTATYAGKVHVPVLLALATICLPGSGWSGIWLAASVLGVISQNKYFPYHWVPVQPPLALLAGMGTVRAWEWLAARVTVLRSRRNTSRLRRDRPPDPSSFSRLLPALPLLWSLIGRWPFYASAAQLWIGALPAAAYEARFGPPGDRQFSALATRWAAEYVRAHTGLHDPVLQWGFEPLILALAERRSPTRFVFHQPLVSRWAPARWRAEFMADLRRAPPVLILVAHNDATPWATGRTADSDRLLQEFPELADFLARHYRFDRRIEDFSCYRRTE